MSSKSQNSLYLNSKLPPCLSVLIQRDINPTALIPSVQQHAHHSALSAALSFSSDRNAVFIH